MKGYIALLAISLGLRLVVFLLIDLPFSADVHLFQFWAVQLFEGGFGDFYCAEFFSDYPPLYMYVLWIVGAIRNIAGFEFLSREFNLLVFMPAIISDVAATLLLYGLCRRAFGGALGSLGSLDSLGSSGSSGPLGSLDSTEFGMAFLIPLAYSLNPGVILNSTIWGQVDGVHTLLLFLALYFVSKRQSLFPYLIYGAAVLTKPQSLIAAPVFLYSAFHYWKERDYTFKAALTMLAYAACTFLFMALVSMPFGLRAVFRQYFDTINQRPFASINAYNFFALTGGIWQEITIFYALLSFVAIVGVTCMAFWLLHRHWNGAAVFFVAALLYVVTFIFSVRMNERYLFPALLFLLTSAVLARNKSDERLPVLYAAFSATFFINCLDVLLRTYDVQLFTLGRPLPLVFRPIDEFIALISAINVALAAYTLKIGRDIRTWTDF